MRDVEEIRDGCWSIYYRLLLKCSPLPLPASPIRPCLFLSLLFLLFSCPLLHLSPSVPPSSPSSFETLAVWPRLLLLRSFTSSCTLSGLTGIAHAGDCGSQIQVALKAGQQLAHQDVDSCSLLNVEITAWLQGELAFPYTQWGLLADCHPFL